MAVWQLKRNALLFDKIYGPEVNRYVNAYLFPHQIADLEFLQARGFLESIARRLVKSHSVPSDLTRHDLQLLNDSTELLKLAFSLTDPVRQTKAVKIANDRLASLPDPVRQTIALNIANEVTADLRVRGLCVAISKRTAIDTVPICTLGFPPILPKASHAAAASTNILRVALDSLPVPDDDCPWMDILDFRSESRDQQWAFRRFLNDVATKRQTEAEIRDDIEWTVNQYRKAMEVHRMKSTQSLVEVFLISPLEVIEDLVKFKWSKIAKGSLQVHKRKVDLMEAEMRAPGRECAYVFDAREHFSKK